METQTRRAFATSAGGHRCRRCRGCRRNDPDPGRSVPGHVERADVPAQIVCLYAAGLVAGTSATTYSPGNVVTREQMAIFLMKSWEEATGIPYAGPTLDFTDTAGSFAAERIRELAG